MVHCLPALDDPFSIGKMVPIFTAVCRAWRDVALTTPTLWSTLRVPSLLISIQIASKPGLVEGMIDRWLARAGTRPVSLIFDGAMLTLNRLRDVINRHSHRINISRST
ncbi:hypothetical protein B0H19DRAFT_113779 [Mycena capillaripes]|nr:hypothetical protein B0H19DRAFT_113779 [Mycena capillaripes]